MIKISIEILSIFLCNFDKFCRGLSEKALYLLNYGKITKGVEP